MARNTSPHVQLVGGTAIWEGVVQTGQLLQRQREPLMAGDFIGEVWVEDLHVVNDRHLARPTEEVGRHQSAMPWKVLEFWNIIKSWSTLGIYNQWWQPFSQPASQYKLQGTWRGCPTGDFWVSHFISRTSGFQSRCGSGTALSPKQVKVTDAGAPPQGLRLRDNHLKNMFEGYSP